MAVMLAAPSDPLDRRASDLLLVRQMHSADPRLLIVEIGPDDLRRYGGPPFSRDGLTMVVNRLADANVDRVLIDSFFGSRLEPAVDARLAAAMARLGPGRLAIGSGLNPRDVPVAEFAKQATVIDVRLTPDSDGWHRQIGSPDGDWGPNPARWLANGSSNASPVPVDLRINPRSIERRSAHELIQSRDDLSGRIVIIGSSALVAPTRAMLPLNRAASRQIVIAAGASSVMDGYQKLEVFGGYANNALRILAIVLGFFCAIASRSGRMTGLIMLATAAVLVTASLWIGREFAVAVYPVQVLTLFVVMVNVTLIQRLRLVTMIGSFLRGDMSPEEVWAWRSWETARHAAVLFGSDGKVKRHNKVAAGIVAEHGDNLAALCMPRLGQRAKAVDFDHDSAGPRHFELDWPFAQAALVVMRDVTEAEEAQRGLEAQLLTDELTGKANRRGFDHALNDAVNSAEDFAVFFVDMNGFKQVNDTHGHDAGDQLLTITAERIARRLKAGDVVARLGGDEFAIVMRGVATREQAESLAKRLASAVAVPVRLDCADDEVRVGAAIGHAVSRMHGRDPYELLRIADKAMYREKLRSKMALVA